MPTHPSPRSFALPLLVLAAALLAPASQAVPPNLNGKVGGLDKVFPDVYLEAAKVDSRRWTWREPSTLVGAQYRSLSVDPTRDVCVVVLSSAGGSPQDAILMKVGGGRITPSTIVVSPGTKLSFKNVDPFPHRMFTTTTNGTWKPEVTLSNTVRQWTAPQGQNTFEIRDELFPSVRGFVVVHPQAIVQTYPARDGTFHFNLPPGEYFLEAYVGRKSAKAVPVTVKGKGVVDIKDPLNLAEGGDPR